MLRIRREFEIVVCFVALLLKCFFLEVSSAAAQIEIDWLENTESDLAGYILSYGEKSGEYTESITLGKVNSYRLDSLQPGKTYFLSILAYDTSFNKSAPSEEITIKVPSSSSSVTYQQASNSQDVSQSAAGKISLYINPGGGRFVDSKGRLWEADSGGLRGKAVKRNKSVKGTKDDRLYQEQREQSGRPFNYHLKLASGRYDLRLHFVELVHKKAGKRSFDVKVEGSPVLSDLDVWEEIGFARPLVKEIKGVWVPDGVMDIRFQAKKGKALVSAIEVIESNS